MPSSAKEKERNHRADRAGVSDGGKERDLQKFRPLFSLQEKGAYDKRRRERERQPDGYRADGVVDGVETNGYHTAAESALRYIEKTSRYFCPPFAVKKNRALCRPFFKRLRRRAGA